jgi:hypothetical protein
MAVVAIRAVSLLPRFALHIAFWASVAAILWRF